MKTISAQQAVQQFDEFSKLAHDGHKILVTREGEPWVILAAPAPAAHPEPGKHKLEWPDFEAPLEEAFPRTSGWSNRNRTAGGRQRGPVLRAYFDSGFLFKLYWRESNSPAAFGLSQKFRPPLVMSRFNEIEMLPGARRKSWMVGPGGVPPMTAAQFQAGFSLFEQELQTGVLARLEVDYDEVFDAAAELSRRFGQTIPVKTADLLPVAMMEFGFDEFVTADKQQHDFAVRAGYPATFLPP